MKFTISKRAAKLSTNMSFRTEFHGDEPVTAGDLVVQDMHLEASELCALRQEPRAFDMMFVSRPNSTLHDPLFVDSDKIKLNTIIDEASVTIFVGVDQVPIELGRCKLKSIVLAPQRGGLTAMSCTVQSTPTLDKRIGELLDHLNAGVYIEVQYNHAARQAGLELEGGAAAAEEPKKRGRKKKSAAAENPPHVVDPDSPEYVPGPMDEATS